MKEYRICKINNFEQIYSDETSNSLSDTIKVGAFVINKPVIVNEEDLVIPDVPFSSLLTPKQTSPPAVSLVDPTNTKTATAAAATDSNNGNNEKINNDNTTSKCASQNGSRRSSCSITSGNDDFIMVDLMVIDVLNWVKYFS